MDGKRVILENVDTLVMAFFLGLLSLLEFWALMLPCTVEDKKLR